MAFSDYSTTPASNGTIAGINVAEGCPPANVNNAIRQLASDGKALSDQVGDIETGMPVTGGTFTGDIKREGRGGYLHFASSALTSGKVYIVADGTARPAAAEGVVVFYY